MNGLGGNAGYVCAIIGPSFKPLLNKHGVIVKDADTVSREMNAVASKGNTFVAAQSRAHKGLKKRVAKGSLAELRSRIGKGVTAIGDIFTAPVKPSETKPVNVASGTPRHTGINVNVANHADDLVFRDRITGKVIGKGTSATLPRTIMG